MIQFVNKKYSTKISIKKKRQKTLEMLENNQPTPQCLAKGEKTPTELLQLIRKSTQYTK